MGINNRGKIHIRMFSKMEEEKLHDKRGKYHRIYGFITLLFSLV